jgi:hypothetical protein
MLPRCRHEIGRHWGESRGFRSTSGRGWAVVVDGEGFGAATWVRQNSLYPCFVASKGRRPLATRAWDSARCGGVENLSLPRGAGRTDGCQRLWGKESRNTFPMGFGCYFCEVAIVEFEVRESFRKSVMRVERRVSMPVVISSPSLFRKNQLAYISSESPPSGAPDSSFEMNAWRRGVKVKWGCPPSEPRDATAAKETA